MLYFFIFAQNYTIIHYQASSPRDNHAVHVHQLPNEMVPVVPFFLVWAWLASRAW